MDADSPQMMHETRRLMVLKKSPIDGQALKRLAEAGLTWLRTNQQIVNSLNVFPVPDGDTGTNMVLTMQAAYEEISALEVQNFGQVAHAIAHGSLMGARGNSGVILSQLWRGFARSVDNQEYLDGPSMVRALVAARDTAYKGVVRPVEGTILTVAKDIAAAAEEALKKTDDPYEILKEIVAAAELSVQHTPELLPVLKEAGVVDAGGKGLFYIYEGMLRYANGQSIDSSAVILQPLATVVMENALESIEPGQDFEVVVDFHPNSQFDLDKYYRGLEEMGTSIQVGEGEGLYRVHIHVPTELRYEPIDFTMTMGTITKVAMENLIAQMEQREAPSRGSKLTLAPVEAGQIAVVAVSPGTGISRVFASLGAAAIVEGGQTMNPSTQEIIDAFENLPTEQIIILPNNKNIIGAAQSTSELTVKRVAVIPSRSVPQGLAAMLRLVPHGEFDEVVGDMTAALNEVETGEITKATRSVEINGVAAREGQYIGLLNGELVVSHPELEGTCLGLLEKGRASDFELITLFYGAALSKSEVNRIVDAIRLAYPNQEVEVQEGGQPHYQFIISIE